MHALRLTWLSLLLIAPTVSANCDCIWQGPFSRVQQTTDLVVSATVTSIRGNSIDLHIDRLLRGEPFTEEVRVWLDTGELCRAASGDFPTGSQWVMALDRIDEPVPGGFNPHTPNISHGRVGDYSLSRCGGYWLHQSEDLVSGNLTGGPRWEMKPKMSPVLLDLVAGYVAGRLDEESLREAGEIDPALQELMINTRVFLKNQH